MNADLPVSEDEFRRWWDLYQSAGYKSWSDTPESERVRIFELINADPVMRQELRTALDVADVARYRSGGIAP